jgi:hypothetical protein
MIVIYDDRGGAFEIHCRENSCIQCLVVELGGKGPIGRCRRRWENIVNI